MLVIDADSHVEESVAMFCSLEKRYYPRRPLALAFDRDTIYGANNAFWVIDGKTFPKLVGRGWTTFRTPTLMESAQKKPAAIGAQELTDVPARLRDLDKVGIDKQVIYPTLFLSATTEDVELEAALLRAYNNFMADGCSQSKGRLYFAALVPMRDIQESVRELRRARSLGAASVMIHGIEWDKVLGKEDLHPFYEEAEKLDIPVCIHLGWGCPALTEVFDAQTNFYAAVLPVVMGFHSVLTSGVLEAFPKLRFACLESGSQWLPWLIHQLRREPGGQRDPATYFREGRFYIACEADEDINYLVQLIGEDALVVASDYPHGDISSEQDMKAAVMAREDVPLRVREKILSSNPQRLYGI